MTDAVKKRTDAQAVLSSDKSDDLKLLEVFQIYKDDLRNKYTELYYALLGWKHSHWTELLKDKKDNTERQVVEVKELIPPSERNGKICATCGAELSVKYLVDMFDGNGKEIIDNIYMCDKCVAQRL